MRHLFRGPGLAGLLVLLAGQVTAADIIWRGTPIDLKGLTQNPVCSVKVGISTPTAGQPLTVTFSSSTAMGAQLRVEFGLVVAETNFSEVVSTELSSRTTKLLHTKSSLPTEFTNSPSHQITLKSVSCTLI